MSIKYKVVKQVFGFDKTGETKYVVKPVAGETLTFDKVRTQVVQICGAHRGVVNQVIAGLIDVMVNNLDMGHGVQLGEFGTLRPGIRAKAQDDEKAADVGTVYRRRINFVPGKMLKNLLRDVGITRMAAIDVDYTDGSGTGEKTGGSNGGTYIDPNA